MRALSKHRAALRHRLAVAADYPDFASLATIKGEALPIEVE
jgi:hypothetical protein